MKLVIHCDNNNDHCVYSNIVIVNIGERKFKRIRILTPKKFTPGVRRSKRKTVQPLVPGELIEYKHHWGSTPQQRLG